MRLVAEPNYSFGLSTRFDNESRIWVSDAMQDKFQIPKITPTTYTFKSPISSASNLSEVVIRHLKEPIGSPIYSTSHVSPCVLFVGQFHAEERVLSVNVETAIKNIYEIRRLTGFTWTRLANLLNVDRRTLNNWINGANIRDKNRQHVANTLGVLRYIDRGLAELNSTALHEQYSQYRLSPFEAIRTGKYEVAKQLLSHGVSRPNRRYIAEHNTARDGDLLPIFMHPDADGTEVIEPLPYEPPSPSRKRPIRRR